MVHPVRRVRSAFWFSCELCAPALSVTEIINEVYVEYLQMLKVALTKNYICYHQSDPRHLAWLLKFVRFVLIGASLLLIGVGDE